MARGLVFPSTLQIMKVGVLARSGCSHAPKGLQLGHTQYEESQLHFCSKADFWGYFWELERSVGVTFQGCRRWGTSTRTALAPLLGQTSGGCLPPLPPPFFFLLLPSFSSFISLLLPIKMQKEFSNFAFEIIWPELQI